MKVYKGKWEDLYKQVQYSNSYVFKIKDINHLEEFLNKPGTIRNSHGDGSKPFDKEILAKSTLKELRNLVREGLVYVSVISRLYD